MTLWLTSRDNVRLFAGQSGAPGEPGCLMMHGLGLGSDVFDTALEHLPRGLRLGRFDARGHGQSDTPGGGWTMGRLVGDAETVLEGLGMSGAVVIAHGAAGLTALGLAVKRPDLVGTLILSGSAAKIGTATTWARRAEMARSGGMDAVARAALPRWFARGFTGTKATEAQLRATSVDGYAGTCAALAGTDLREVASGLTQKVLCIAGAHDQEVPPDLVSETARTIPNAEYVLLRRAGHLPFVDHPEAFGAAVTGFLTEIGLVSKR